MHNQKLKCKHCGKEFSKYGIKTHIWRVHGEGQKFDPNKGFKNGTRTAWNKGLTKDDKRVAAYAKTNSENYKNGKNVGWCQGLTKDTDERISKLSNKISETVKTKIENDEWHLSFSHSRIYEYKGIKFHGKWELNYAKYLDEKNTKWERPVEKFPYFFDEKKRYYTPDFYLPDENLYIEIKGYPTDKDYAKWKNFPHKLKVIFGKDLYKMGIIDSYRKIEIKNY